jgi:chromosomal replication initiator protein
LARDVASISTGASALPAGPTSTEFAPTLEKNMKTMTSTELDRWSRVKGRLRAEIGEDVFSSWFARMDLEALEEGTVRLSVPTRFLKSWIQSH